jgi:hypothetical protein
MWTFFRVAGMMSIIAMLVLGRPLFPSITFGTVGL